MAKIWPRIEKLRKMDWRELTERIRQEFYKRSDAMLSRFGYVFAKQTQASRQAQPGKFLFENEQIEVLLQLIRERLPEQAAQIVSRAGKICAHHFDLLGYQDLDYGASITWHLDAVHGKTAPRKPFHQIQYLDFAEVGDSKVTWELNRHQHLVTLAKAYRLTNDERFAQEIVSQWQSWHVQNPYPIGINWASSLEVAFRALSWMWVYALLDGTKVFTEEFRGEYLRAQAVNGRHIERYLSTYFSPNTHLLGEGVALFCLGIMCPGLERAERWKSMGWKIVLEAAERQVNPDGFHFEQSTYYHVYALDFFLHAALLASANGISLPKNFEETIERMMDVLYLLGRAGPPARFGDDDGGRVFDPARNREEHLVDPLSLGAILFGRADFKVIARDLREETIWLAGAAGVAQWNSIDAKSGNAKSSAMPYSGIYILSSLYSTPQSYSQLIVKTSPVATAGGGHSHADALGLCLQSSGKSLLIDPGTCEYVGSVGKRNQYRGTAAHNTVTVDERDQADPDGAFSWKQKIPAKVERWVAGETFTLFIGRHDGYARLAKPAVHKRCVVSLKSGIFLVRDLVEGEGEHRLDLSWMLQAELQLQQEHLFRLKKSSPGLAVLPAQDHVWAEEAHKSFWSPAYGAERRTTVLKFGRSGRLPAEFATLLAPLADAAAIPGKFVRLRPEGASDLVRAYHYETKELYHLFFFAPADTVWSCGPVKSDAEFVFITTRGTSHTPDLIVCNGSYVELEGKRILNAKRTVARCEVLNGEEPQIFCSDLEAVTETSLSNTEIVLIAEEST
jgi:hypothetical protein